MKNDYLTYLKLKKNIVLICFLFFLYLSYSQTDSQQNYYLIKNFDINTVSQADSILIDTNLYKFHNTTEDTVKVNAILKIIDKSWDDNVWPKYNEWLNQFLKQKIENKNIDNQLYYKENYANTLNNKGYFYNALGDIKQAEKYYLESLNTQIEIGNKKGVGSALSNLASLYESQGDISKALDYYNKSIEIRGQVNDDNGISICYNNIGYILDDQGYYDEALDYYKKSLSIQKNIVGDKEAISSGYNNIGYVYYNQKDYIKALDNYNKALTIRFEQGDKDGIANSYNNIATVYEKLNDEKNALYYYNQALEIAEELSDKQSISNILNNIAEIELQNGSIKEAEKKFNRAYKIALELGFPSQISKSAKYLSQIAINKHNYKEAYEKLELHLQMKDSINSLKTQKETIKQQAKYEYEKQKVIDDAENKRKIAIEKEQKKKQEIISLIIGVGGFVLAIFLVIVINRLRVTRQQKRIIENQKKRVELAHKETERQKKVVEKQKQLVEEHHQAISSSINYAKRLQDAILPDTIELNRKLVNNFIFYQTKDVVSGDFYWYKCINGVSYIAVADCTGHGVPGAMVSVVCSNALNRSVKEFNLKSPSKILDKTRELVIETFSKSEGNVKDGMDVSFCKIEGENLTFSGAYNPLWIIRKIEHLTEEQKISKSIRIQGNIALIEIKADRQPIGFHEIMVDFTETAIKLFKEDSLYMFSDGFADQFGGEYSKKYKSSNFKNLLLKINHFSMDKQKKMIKNEFDKWKGSHIQIDDICVMGIKID